MSTPGTEPSGPTPPTTPGAHPAVVAAALMWREHRIGDPVAAVDVLAEHLIGRYREFVGAYAAVEDPMSLYALRARL